jgi:uncharacterized protein
MIINSHCHMARLGLEFSQEMADFYLNNTFAGQDCWATGQPWTAQDFCVPVEKLIADMDRTGVDMAFVLGIAYLPMKSYTPDGGDYAAHMVSQYPDRLIGFYTANPLGGLAEVRRFERGVKELGLRGLKMLPSYNYVAIKDRRIWPLYEAAQEMGVPVLLHSGWSSLPHGKMLDHDHPLYAEDVLLDFPNMKLILAHVGFQWAEETIFMMAKFPNVYADVAFWAESTPLWRTAQIWTWAKQLGVFNRFLWGSDYPYVDFQPGIDLFNRVPEYCIKHDLEPAITQEDLDSFFGGAAARVIGLAPELITRKPHC